MNFADFLSQVNDVVWSRGIPVAGGEIPLVVLLLLGTGLYLTFYLGFIQLRRLVHGFAVTTGRYDDPDEPGDVSHFEALTTALSATVGIGNIAGVALAIHFGGPGALFWMWLTAFLGMATKYSEVTLAQEYRDVEARPSGEEMSAMEKIRGTVSGGPMYYIEKGLGKSWKPMAIFFAIMLIFTSFLTGNAVQANTVADTMSTEFGVVPWLSGIVLVVVIGAVIVGGISRIGRVTSIVAPAMAAVYVSGALVILAFNAGQILPMLGRVVMEAFNPSAGVAGTGVGVFIFTLTYGVQRGLFSNEAGQGSAPIAHSAAQTDEPPSEGVVALLEPLIDTIIICTLTALVILVTGVWDEPVPTDLNLGSGDLTFRTESAGLFADAEAPKAIAVEAGRPQQPAGAPTLSWHEAAVERFYTQREGSTLSAPFSGTIYPREARAVAEDGTEYETLYGNAVENGAPLTTLAFQRGLAPLGDWGGYIVIVSVLLFAISTSISWSYYGDRCANYLFGESAILPYKGLFLLMNFVGSVGALTIIWTIGDIALGLVIIPNLIGVLFLSPKLRAITKSYFKREPWHENEKVQTRIREEKRRAKDERM